MTTKEAASNTIYCVGGSMEGVRKSMVTMAILDDLMEMAQKPLLSASDVMPESLSGVRRQRATDLKRGGHAYVATSAELRENP
jgi:hypothetical protein